MQLRSIGNGGRGKLVLFLKRSMSFPDIMVVPQITHLVINYKETSVSS